MLRGASFESESRLKKDLDALKNDLQNSKSKFNQMEEAASKFMHHGAGSRAPGQLRSNDKDDNYIRD